MNNNIKIIFAFTLGAAAGVAATWRFFKTKYETIAQEEIDSVKEVYSKKNAISEDTTDTREDDGYVAAKEELHEYKSMTSDLGYSNTKKERGLENMDDKPRIIPPEQFGEIDEYDRISLIYYEDGVLTDDLNDPIDDIEDVVGIGFDTHFGEYEDDTVYVINDKFKTYYEVLRDYSRYADLREDK